VKSVVNGLGILALALCLFHFGGGCSPIGEADVNARVLDLERRLITTCACHPRKIEGLPIQHALRADLKAWIEEGHDENEILWLAFRRYGKELLAAGVENLEGLVKTAAAIVAFIAVSGLFILAANLRRETRGENIARTLQPPSG
jgi:hypothetical protein